MFNIKNTLFIRKLFLKDKRKEIPAIISLASYPGANRHETVYLTIESLLTQTLKPKKILLWLYEGEFPNKEKDLPKKLISLQNNIFEIRWSKKNIRSYNKIINTLEEYPNEIIVTADDDLIYQDYWLESLWNSYSKDSSYIYAHLSTKFYKEKGKWMAEGGFLSFYEEASFINKLCSGGGVLFPKNTFHEDILKEELFKSLAPTNDDLWLWAMVTLNDKKVSKVDNPIPKLIMIPNTQEIALFHINDFGEELYWTQFNNLINYYPDFKEKLEKEWLLFNQ